MLIPETLFMMLKTGAVIAGLWFIFKIGSQLAIRDSESRDDNEKPSFADTVLPGINRDPKAAADFYGKCIIGICLIGYGALQQSV